MYITANGYFISSIMSDTGVADDVVKLIMTGIGHLLSLGSAICVGNMLTASWVERKASDGN